MRYQKLVDLQPRSPVPDDPKVRVKLRIEGHRDLPKPTQSPPIPTQPCRANHRGECIWAGCPRPQGFARTGARRCPLDALEDDPALFEHR